MVAMKTKAIGSLCGGSSLFDHLNILNLKISAHNDYNYTEKCYKLQNCK